MKVQVPRHFAEILAEESPMTFAHYMELALYHPEYGYYARSPKIGKKGDYITAPSIHPVFGATVAKQIIEIWEIMGKPQDFVVCEAGAGEGYLALDILDYLKQKDFAFPYYILEPFSANRLRQEEVLEKHFDQVKWFSSWKEVPSFKGVFISNELFDSFPVHLVQKTEGELREVYISFKNGVKELLAELSRPEILQRVSPFVSTWKEGYRTEVCLAYESFLKGLSQKLIQGVIITFDYGYGRRDYYHEERTRGTLLCFQEHRIFENPYLFPGKCDLTAHVDFTALKEIGEKLGFCTYGFTSQASFLVGLGVERLLAEIGRTQTKDIEALKMLLLPQGLGMSHWVLIQGRGLSLETKFSGFKLSNRLKVL